MQGNHTKNICSYLHAEVFGSCFFSLMHSGMAKLECILAYHIKELKHSTWDGDYDDIAKRHLALIKDVWSSKQKNANRLPTKSEIMSAVNTCYPEANQIMKDKARDSLVNVFRHIKGRLKSCTTGKKMPPHLKEMLDSLKDSKMQVLSNTSSTASSSVGKHMLPIADEKKHQKKV